LRIEDRRVETLNISKKRKEKKEKKKENPQ